MAAAIAFCFSVLLLAVVAVVEAAETPTHLSFFMHDIVSGSDPTSVKVIEGPGSGTSSTARSLGMSFGDTSVIDDLLTETSSATSSAVGRMQGVYMLSSQSGAALMVTANILLTSGDYNGSTIAVMGRDDVLADVRELSVVGGTGKFRMADGYVLWKTNGVTNAGDATVQLDVYLANSTASGDASAPGASPVDGGSSGSAGGGSKSSSDAGSRIAGGKWVLAVAAAVVGSCWMW